MSKIAAVDLGTNSIRLLLCQVDNGEFKQKRKEVITTRIGKNLLKTNSMSEKAMTKNIEALRYFKNKSANFGAYELIVIATSAVREASNRDIFLQKVKEETNIDIKVIDGKEEAYIGMLGVTYDICQEEDILILDIGGGSSELILSKGRKIKYSDSVDVGAVKITERFISSNPITDTDISGLSKHIDKSFEKSIEFLNKENIGKLIAIGGTATTLAGIFHEIDIYSQDKIHNTILDNTFLEDAFERLRTMGLKERYEVKGLEKERADIIPAGIYIIKSIMEKLNKDKIFVSDNDNLEGAVIRYSKAFNVS